MRALITGSGGFAGQHLARLLEDEGHLVSCFDLQQYHQDVRNYEDVLTAVRLTEPDWVFHLAAVSWPRESIADPRRCVDVNVTGTLNVLEAVRNSGGDAAVLLAGTSEEYGYEFPRAEITEESACYPTTPYGATKLAAGALGLAYARRHGMHVVITRAFNHTGWGRQACNAESAFARRIVAFERGQATAVAHGDLEAVRNFTNVADVVRAYRLAVTLEPGIYNVCSGDSVPMRTVMDLLIDASGLPHVPLREQPGLGTPERWPFPVPQCRPLRNAGWQPLIPLKDTMAELIAYWRSR